jgi:hypothetical protein
MHVEVFIFFKCHWTSELEALRNSPTQKLTRKQVYNWFRYIQSFAGAAV